MKLNKRIPGLPQWPPIHEERDHYVVIAKHVTYWRFFSAQLLLPFVVLAAFILPFVVFDEKSDFRGVGFVAAIVFMFLAVFPFTLRILCRLIFPRLTVVRFDRSNVKIGSLAYEILPNVAIQFRAQRPAMSELKLKKLEQQALSEREVPHSSWRMRFRRVEMIYGMQIVPITTVADETRAEQFAVALQAALSLACAVKRPEQAKTSAASRQRIVEDDALPE